MYNYRVQGTGCTGEAIVNTGDTGASLSVVAPTLIVGVQ